VILSSKAAKLRPQCAITPLHSITTVENIMAEQTPAQFELAELLVDALNLEDIAATDIDPKAPLFGDGLGLDSIDALEIALAISQKYGVQMQAEDTKVRNAFANLETLADFVHAYATK
jgi:acyl carrier protein